MVGCAVLVKVKGAKYEAEDIGAVVKLLVTRDWAVDIVTFAVLGKGVGLEKATNGAAVADRVLVTDVV